MDINRVIYSYNNFSGALLVGRKQEILNQHLPYLEALIDNIALPIDVKITLHEHMLVQPVLMTSLGGLLNDYRVREEEIRIEVQKEKKRAFIRAQDYYREEMGATAKIPKDVLLPLLESDELVLEKSLEFVKVQSMTKFLYDLKDCYEYRGRVLEKIYNHLNFITD